MTSELAASGTELIRDEIVVVTACGCESSLNAAVLLTEEYV